VVVSCRDGTGLARRPGRTGAGGLRDGRGPREGKQLGRRASPGPAAPWPAELPRRCPQACTGGVPGAAGPGPPVRRRGGRLAGSGVGTAPSSLRTPRPTRWRAGGERALLGQGRRRCPRGGPGRGVKGVSGPARPPDGRSPAAQASWSPAACLRTWVTVSIRCNGGRRLAVGVTDQGGRAFTQQQVEG